MSKKPTKAASDNFDERLKALDEKLDRHEKIEEGKKSPKPVKAGYGNAMKMSSEFIAAILVGAGIGYTIDYFAGTLPWAMIFFFGLGFVAGVRNVLRTAGETVDPYQSGLSKTGGSKKEGPSDLYDD